jgi:hypothetical protein
MTRPTGRNFVSLSISFIVYLSASGNGGAVAQAASNGVHLIQLPFVAEKVRSLQDHSIVVMYAKKDGKIQIQRQTSQGDEVWRVSLDHSASDVSISKGEHFICFAGRPLGANSSFDASADQKAGVDQKTIVSRVNIEKGSLSKVEVNIGSGEPTVSFGEKRELYVGLSTSSKIHRIDEESFEEGRESSSTAASPEVLANNPELAGVSDLTTTQSGQVLLVSSLRPRGVSAMEILKQGKRGANTFELSLGKWIGYLPVPGSEVSGSDPIALKLSASDSNAQPAGKENGKSSIVVADFGPTSRLLVAELDKMFGAFAVVQSVDLKFIMPSPAGTDLGDRVKSRLLLSSDLGQQKIVVGSQLFRDIFIYRRNGAAIELVGTRTLATAPVDLSVSRDGSSLAILMSRGSQVEITQPFDITPNSTTAPVSPEQAKNVAAQRALSQLGYVVGSVDGQMGPQTIQALSLFQRDAHIKVTGGLDADTIRALVSLFQSDASLKVTGGLDADTIRLLVSLFQRDAGLKVSGVLDADTIRALQTAGQH